MSTFIHLMRGQMSKPLDELGGKCPYMPFLDRGKCPRGNISVPLFKHLLYSYKFSYILKIFPIFLGKFVADEYIVKSSALILPFASLFFILYFLK